MFLSLAHTKLDAFTISREFTLSCNRETKLFPNEEKFAFTQQIRRASLSVHLNLAEDHPENDMWNEKSFMKYQKVQSLKLILPLI